MPTITLFSLVPNSLFNTCSVIMDEPDVKVFSRWHCKVTGGGKVLLLVLVLYIGG